MASSNLTYTRNTTYTIGITYSNTNGINGQTAMFTVKPTQYDADAADTANAIIKKDVTLSANNGTITINPTDVSYSVAPGLYYYDVKVLDTSGAIYLIASGKFTLVATPTNRET